MNNLMFKLFVMGASCLMLLTNCKKDNENTVLLDKPQGANTQVNGPGISSLLFNGDAANGVANVWKDINVEQNGSVTTVTDETGTLCWKFLKPVGSHRAEGHGAKNFQALEGSEIYIGWTSKIYIPVSLKTEAVFQWKSYPTATASANHPLMLHTVNGHLELQYFDENHVATVLWSIPISSGTWQKFVIHMKVSKSDAIGFVEFWYNGVKQTLSNGSQHMACRTLDSDFCDPKWGVYGGDTAQVTHIVKGIRIASTYADAAQ